MFGRFFLGGEGGKATSTCMRVSVRVSVRVSGREFEHGRCGEVGRGSRAKTRRECVLLVAVSICEFCSRVCSFWPGHVRHECMYAYVCVRICMCTCVCV